MPLTKLNSASVIERLPVGSVIQTVSAVHSSSVQTGGASADTGLTCSITPSSTSNKILIIVNQPLSISADTNSARDINFKLAKSDGTVLTNGMAEISNQTGGKVPAYNAIVFLDSPNTSSSVTYKTTFGVNSGSVDVYANQHGAKSTMTLQEIKG